MASDLLDRRLPAIVFAVAIGLLALRLPVGAQQCVNSCARGRSVCAMQARTAFIGCAQSCAAGDLQCRAVCRAALRTARAGCRAMNSDCTGVCPSVPAAASGDAACPLDCSSTAKGCFLDALTAGKTCTQTCSGMSGVDAVGCFTACAAAIRNSGTDCLAAFQTCLGDCQGPVSGTCFSTLAMECTTQPCGPDQPCAQPNEFCSQRCASPAPDGVCFDPNTQQCSDQKCSVGQPCANGNQTCVPACPAPPPQGKCFDPSAKQCTDETCGSTHHCSGENQVCTLQCPPPPQQGSCFDISAMQCTDQHCSDTSPCTQSNQRCVRECPPPTPIGQCAAATCGGKCMIGPNCPPGVPCPEIVSRLGTCTLDANDACSCVPASPPPTPTAVPTAAQCTDVPCGGKCVIGPNCQPGMRCPEFPSRLGACEIDATGACTCMPATPPPTPTAVPTVAQCTDSPCGGKCVIGPSCPPGMPCPEFPSRPGQCVIDANGACDCVPIPPLPTPTRRATPESPCSAVPCGGKCVSTTNCLPGMACPDSVTTGQCQLDSVGSCNCVPLPPRATPTARPTPLPPCDANACGGSCTISIPCILGLPCDKETTVKGQCVQSADGSCACIPPTPVPLPTPIPQCSGATCAGDCEFAPHCVGDYCPKIPAGPGRCVPDTVGNCVCVLWEPPTPTPASFPRCDAANCGGLCFTPYPCPDGLACPGALLLGKCTVAADGSCACMPTQP